MNHPVRIKLAARAVAAHLTDDVRKRNEVADDLVHLIGLMISATGNEVAGMTGWYSPDEYDDSARIREQTGQDIRSAVVTVVSEVNAVDLCSHCQTVGDHHCEDGVY